MPFAVIRKQVDGTSLYLIGPDQDNVDEMMWTADKSRALPFTTSEKAEFVVRLIELRATIGLDVVGLKQEGVS